MKEANNKYTFSLGKMTGSPRTYQGTLLPPMEGFKIGTKAVKLLACTAKDDTVLEEIKCLIDSSDQSDSSNDDLLSNGIKLFAKILQEFDIDGYLEMVDMIVLRTCIHAKVDGETASALINSKADMNKWFTKYPQDLLLFTANIIFRNSSPFLPEEWGSLAKLGQRNEA